MGLTAVCDSQVDKRVGVLHAQEKQAQQENSYTSPHVYLSMRWCAESPDHGYENRLDGPSDIPAYYNLLRAWEKN